MNQKYDDTKFRYLHPSDQLVKLMERVYRYGMTTTSGGNLSVKDEDGTIWITPGSIDKGNLRRDDIVRVTADGKVEGNHPPSSEYPFHKAIYDARPDLNAVLHAHPPALVAYSASGIVPHTDILPNTRRICGELDFVPYEVPGSEELGARIAASFAKGHNIVILENHGVVTAAEDLFRAFMQFETLEFTARIQIKSRIFGNIRHIKDEERALFDLRRNEMPEFDPGIPISREQALRYEMCEFIHRSYDRNLFTSTDGTFAARVSENSFLITPYGYDRRYLEPADLVLIRDGKRETGKLPSRSVKLQEVIFAKRPDTNAVIIAHPPNLMAFNIAEKEMNTRVIPEAYIMLRDISRLPIEAPLVDFDSVAAALSESAPLAMVQNNCVLVTGKNLLNAFDRLEVAEYTAKAVLGSYKLGSTHIMEDRHIEVLKDVFDLPD